MCALRRHRDRSRDVRGARRNCVVAAGVGLVQLAAGLQQGRVGLAHKGLDARLDFLDQVLGRIDLLEHGIEAGGQSKAVEFEKLSRYGKAVLGSRSC